MKDLLPREIVNRRKRGLAAPYQSWMRGPLPHFASEMLSNRSLKKKGYFDPQGVHDLMARHRAGQANYGGQILAVLIGQLWDEIFVRRPLEAPAT
jgi:asparagine synthase (glutamine-hydrolysing)